MLIHCIQSCPSLPHLTHLLYIQFNFTPLHMAAISGHGVVAQLLLKAGADKEVKGDVSID